MITETLETAIVGKKPGVNGDPPHEARSERDVESAAQGLGEMGGGPFGLGGNASPEDVQLRNLARDINGHHEDHEKGLRTSLNHAREAGKKLLEAKKLVGHGNFANWLKTNCGFSMRTAQKYMRIARRWGDLAKEASATGPSTIEGVLDLLANSTSAKAEEVDSRPSDGSSTKPRRNGLSEAIEKEIDAQFANVFEDVVCWIKEAAEDLCKAVAEKDHADPNLVAQRLAKAVRKNLVPTKVFRPTRSASDNQGSGVSTDSVQQDVAAGATEAIVENTLAGHEACNG